MLKTWPRAPLVWMHYWNAIAANWRERLSPGQGILLCVFQERVWSDLHWIIESLDDLAEVGNWWETELPSVSEVKEFFFSVECPIDIDTRDHPSVIVFVVSRVSAEQPMEQNRAGRGGWIDSGQETTGQEVEGIYTNNIWSDKSWGWGKEMKPGRTEYIEWRQRFSYWKTPFTISLNI